TRSELDDIGDAEHYQERFLVVINVFVSDDERRPNKPMPWSDHTTRNITPDILFSSKIEKDENFDTFVNPPGTQNDSPVLPPRVPRAPLRPAPPTPRLNTREYRDSSGSDSDKPPTEEREDLLDSGREDAAYKTTPSPEVDLLGINGGGGDGVPGVDLLNLSASMRSGVNAQPASNVDLLGGFGSAPSTGEGEFGDLQGLLRGPAKSQQSHAPKNDFLFDPFGGSDAQATGSVPAFPLNQDTPTRQAQTPKPPTPNLLGSWDGLATPQTAAPGLSPMPASIPRNASTPNLESRARDPFADIGNLGANLNAGWAGGSKPTTPINGTPRAGSPNNLGSGGSPQHRPSQVRPTIQSAEEFSFSSERFGIRFSSPREWV
ncbi:unnamed protein product, partial [Timema podura]|nr:unnamed protein product [Timema podura]